MDAPVEQEFKLLSLKDFSANTQNLLPWFKIDKKVFFICPNLKEMCESIERTAKIYQGDRGSQLEVFTKLVEKFHRDAQLKKVIKGTDPGKPEVIRQALELLLGTLVHRLWKIQNPDTISKASFASIFKSVASAVVKVPQYSQLETIVIFPTLNNITCLDDIDALAIYNSCRTLSLFMKENNRYLEFPHYQKDAGFFDSLQAIQNHYQPKAFQINQKMDQLLFLGVLATDLEKLNDNLQKLLLELKTRIDEAEPVSLNELHRILISQQTPLNLANRFIYLVKRPEMEDSFTDWATFEKRAKAWIELQCAYALFGAYYVLYDLAGSSDEGYAMQQVLLNGINPVAEVPLNKEDSLYGVRTLFHFYLAYANTEQQVNWKLYNSAGKVEILMQDCRTVEQKLSQQPEQTQSSAFGFNF